MIDATPDGTLVSPRLPWEFHPALANDRLLCLTQGIESLVFLFRPNQGAQLRYEARNGLRCPIRVMPHIDPGQKRALDVHRRLSRIRIVVVPSQTVPDTLRHQAAAGASASLRGRRFAGVVFTSSFGAALADNGFLAAAGTSAGLRPRRFTGAFASGTALALGAAFAAIGASEASLCEVFSLAAEAFAFAAPTWVSHVGLHLIARQRLRCLWFTVSGWQKSASRQSP